jgi:glycosyltransferase involved in cell wall biosynthesis
MRVCHLAYTFYEIDNRVIRYAEALAQQGAEVDVIALSQHDQPRYSVAEGVRVFRIQRRTVSERRAYTYLLKTLLFAFLAFLRLGILQLRRPYDVVHVHNLPDFLVFAAIVPKLMGAKVILDIHDLLPELYAGKFGGTPGSRTFRLLQLLEWTSCWFADHVIVANHLWHEKLIKRAIHQHKCTTIMNYPDLRRFRPQAKGTKASDKFIMLYPGTLNRHQGVDVAIRAFAQVADAIPEAELHIYGDGPARDELSHLVQELGLSHRITLARRVSLEKISRIIAAADVGIIPKRADVFGDEAFSTKTLEFMACGIPIIVSRTRIDEHYFSDALVRFVAPGSEQDLAAAMRSVYTDRLETVRRVRAARDFAVENSWQNRGSIYTRLIEKLTARSLEETVKA